MGDHGDIMKTRGKLAHILVDTSPKVYGPYITYENEKSVLYLQLLKTLYEILIT